MYELTNIYWIKNEARYIPEYIEFHLLQGYDHFVFYDNKSDDNLIDVISPYVEDGLAEVRYYPENDPLVNVMETGAKNYWIMEHTTKEFRNKTKWLSHLATDERVFCIDGTKLPEALKEYEHYGGLSIPWHLFPSNGHIKRPEGLIIDNYTVAWDDPGRHVRTITNPRKAEYANTDPHNYWYGDGSYSVTEDHVKISGAFADTNKIYGKKFMMHHYITLSKEEWYGKMNKGNLDSKERENKPRPRIEEQWIELNSGIPWVGPGRDLEVPLVGNGIGLMYTNTTLCKYSKPIKDSIRNRYAGREHLLQYINH